MGRLVFSDVDGVLTDSKINISEEGELFKSFNVKDGLGIDQWQKTNGNEFVIITARESQAVRIRASELNISEVHQGVSDKQTKIEEIANRLGFDISNVVYIGDDISDLDAIRVAGFACCPADAPSEVKAECSYISQKKGGDGVVRDVLSNLDRRSQTTLGVIPARFGSTRFPGKPLADIAGKPMIQRVYERANQAKLLDDLVVATDDERIAEVIDSIGGDAVITRSNHPTGTDRVTEVAEKISSDYIINIQGDEPLIDPAVIDAIIRRLQQDPPKVATPISEIKQPSQLNDENTVKVVTDSDGRALYFSRSKIPYGSGPGTTYKHIGLYGFETEFLFEYVDMESELEQSEDLEQLRILENGYDIQTVITDYESKEVNVKNDITIIEEKLLEEKNED